MSFSSLLSGAVQWTTKGAKNASKEEPIHLSTPGKVGENLPAEGHGGFACTPTFLIDLDLSSTMIGAGGRLKLIASALEENYVLTSLNLCDCGIMNEGANILSNALKRNSNSMLISGSQTNAT
jgi:hypothetical protein